MTSKAKELLQKMASAIDQGHENDFDIDFYIGTPDIVLDELDRLELITKKNNIIGSIVLKEAGYDAAKS